MLPNVWDLAANTMKNYLGFPLFYRDGTCAENQNPFSDCARGSDADQSLSGAAWKHDDSTSSSEMRSDEFA